MHEGAQKRQEWVIRGVILYDTTLLHPRNNSPDNPPFLGGSSVDGDVLRLEGGEQTEQPASLLDPHGYAVTDHQKLWFLGQSGLRGPARGGWRLADAGTAVCAHAGTVGTVAVRAASGAAHSERQCREGQGGGVGLSGRHDSLAWRRKLQRH